MTPADVPGAVDLQKSAFPPPFSEDLHWDPEHLLRHIELFPEGQFVAEANSQIVGTCSNTIIDEAAWSAHAGWYRSVGGPDLNNFTRSGTTLYGLDITVHPSFRRQGIGRAFYETRFHLVRSWPLTRYGTGCRIPDYSSALANEPGLTPERYAAEVADGSRVDRTLTPLLRYGLNFLMVIHRYMPDEESADCGALLEWLP